MTASCNRCGPSTSHASSTAPVVFGDENRCRSARNGKLNHSGLVSVGAALRFVELLQARQGGLGDKPEPVGAGATSGRLAAAGDQHHGSAGRRARAG